MKSKFQLVYGGKKKKTKKLAAIFFGADYLFIYSFIYLVVDFLL